MPTANVYVDGFNLYYRCLQNTPYKWLDLSKLAALLLPQTTIGRIRYFTAHIQARPDDLDAPTRQAIYLRALQSIPNLTIHFGHFLSDVKRMRLAEPIPGGPTMVNVIRTDEKGSDVNLATYLLLDAFRREADTALVISNDSDLAEPVRIVRSEFNVRVGVTHPCRGTPSHTLQSAAAFVRRTRNGVLLASQFPPTLTDAKGRPITKPARW